MATGGTAIDVENFDQIIHYHPFLRYDSITPAAALPCMVSEQLEKDAERKSNGRPPDKRVHAGHKNDTSRCGPLHLPSTMGEAARLPRRRDGLGSPCQSFYANRSRAHHALGARSAEMPRGATPTAAIWRVRRASMSLPPPHLLSSLATSHGVGWRSSEYFTCTRRHFPSSFR